VSGRAVLRLAAGDNVATALRPLVAGEVVEVAGQSISVLEPLPLCHKLALGDLEVGAAVIKYGQPIGAATAAIPAGSHVHVHNMRSARARQSLPE
jgi:altronate dehydratase